MGGEEEGREEGGKGLYLGYRSKEDCRTREENCSKGSRRKADRFKEGCCLYETGSSEEGCACSEEGRLKEGRFAGEGSGQDCKKDLREST